MKKAIIYSKGVATSTDAMIKPEPIFAQGDYDVFVGALDPEKLPMYVVINRTSGVVEMTTEVTQFYKEWLGHFAPVEFSSQAGQQLDLSLAN